MRHFHKSLHLYKGCVCNYLTRKEAAKQAQQSSLRSKLVFYLAASYCWKHNQVTLSTIQFFLTMYRLHFAYLGYKPPSKRHKKSHKQVKRDEVVLFDNVKEYNHRPGE